jgi:CcmD family protein
VAFVLGVVPALPLGKAGRYVAAAYIVVFAIVVIYVAIMALRLSRMERELGELVELADDAAAATETEPSLLEETVA